MTPNVDSHTGRYSTHASLWMTHRAGGTLVHFALLDFSALRMSNVCSLPTSATSVAPTIYATTFPLGLGAAAALIALIALIAHPAPVLALIALPAPEADASATFAAASSAFTEHTPRTASSVRSIDPIVVSMRESEAAIDRSSSLGARADTGLGGGSASGLTEKSIVVITGLASA